MLISEHAKQHREVHSKYLSKNGRGKYAVVDINEYERQQATIQLLTELARGEQSAKGHGWLTIDEVEANLESKMAKLLISPDA